MLARRSAVNGIIHDPLMIAAGGLARPTTTSPSSPVRPSSLPSTSARHNFPAMALNNNNNNYTSPYPSSSNISVLTSVPGGPSVAAVAGGTAATKATVAVGLKNIAGSLFKMASCFALRDIDIIKIESRPAASTSCSVCMSGGAGVTGGPLTSLTPTPARASISTAATAGSSVAVAASSSVVHHRKKHWDQIYYIDYTPSTSPAVNAALLANLQEFCLWVRELGYYSAGLHHEIEVVPTEWRQILDVVSY